MCKVEIGFDENCWGEVEHCDGEYEFTGEHKDWVKNLLESMGGYEDDKSAFICSLPGRLTGRVWASWLEGCEEK